MDDLFKIRVLTAAVNEMASPAMIVYNRLFQGREHLELSDRLAFDVISGSRKILGNVSVTAPATISNQTSRRTVTVTALRLAAKRFIPTADLNALRLFGGELQTEQMKTRLARELSDMRSEIDRTIEFWACGAIKGKIYDSDLSTVLVDYGLDAEHDLALSGTALWTNASSRPLSKIRDLQRTIERDAGTSITGWLAFLGSGVMDALLAHSSITELVKFGLGVQVAQSGRIQSLANVELIEYNASFLDATGLRRQYIDPDQFVLVGLCPDLVDTPFAPIIDEEAPGGVGNTLPLGAGALYFAKSWEEKDPSGRWVKAEARPLPVLMRPGAVVKAKVV